MTKEETWKSLPQHRQTEIDTLLSDTVNSLKLNPKFEFGKIYPIEITKAFDSEHPKQWLYLKMVFSVIRRKGIIAEMGEQEYDMVHRMFEEIEIYDETDYYPDWVDHISRISESVKNNENQMFYENKLYGDSPDKNSTTVGEETKNEAIDGLIDMMDKLEGKKD